ncbi:Lck interacting transmembrane adaptor 1 [Willisornis vidua]|uniref:Lck interacting transmembrane adaptor 1 n=1 Tax=Willisornis vidua TaxID=1566151 RepID=A0ABQ9DFC3_9PASS|nr:Lck interacting transmembrane adaptor 1 [Willisornis vidua]
MAGAGAEGTAGTPILLPGAALALLGGLVYLGALCAACRRKGRKKVAPDGVKLVDESLLRQTQLRSLSRSDTKLHELYRVKARGDAQRPASLDVPCPAAPGAESLPSSGLLHRQLPRIPVYEPPAASLAPDQTYSNLLFTPLRKPTADMVYECLAVGGEDAPVSLTPTGTQVSPPRGGHGAADYACVHKVKKTVPVEVQDGAMAGPSGAQQCWDGTGNAPRAQGHGPDPDYETVDINWKKAAKRGKLGKTCVPENLYESVGDIWAGEPRRASTRTTANGLEVYITNL